MLLTSGTKQTMVDHQNNAVNAVYRSMIAFKIEDRSGTQHTGEPESKLNPVAQTQLITTPQNGCRINGSAGHTGPVSGDYLPVFFHAVKGRMLAGNIGLQSDICRFAFTCGSPNRKRMSHVKLPGTDSVDPEHVTLNATVRHNAFP